MLVWEEEEEEEEEEGTIAAVVGRAYMSDKINLLVTLKTTTRPTYASHPTPRRQEDNPTTMYLGSTTLVVVWKGRAVVFSVDGEW